MPRWVNYVECYHGHKLDTNVIAPDAEGIDGLAYGDVIAG
jgi:hypothetical protein